MKEKYTAEDITTEIIYEESKIKSFNRKTNRDSSYRIHRDGCVGIHQQRGEITDEEGFAKAEANWNERPRPYPFELEVGARSRDMTERRIADKELLDTAKECMKYIREKYPQFTFSGNFNQFRVEQRWVNDKGMDYSNVDCAVSANIGFKHVDSKDISDGGFGFSQRTFDKEVFFKMADNYLSNYETEVDFPEEIIIDMQYYGVASTLAWHLNGENLALGTSLLSGKVGEKVFSENLTLTDDVSDEECWFDRFWDGDGCVWKNDKLTLIEKGVILTGYADKKTAKKYNIPHTGSAYADYSDIPGPGTRNIRIKRSEKTIKELLNGRYCVIPISCGGGGFAENGDYTMPVHLAILSDGEKILGKLPPFTIVSNLFDMFGEDFIGVGADNPIFNDKQILFRAKKGKL